VFGECSLDSIREIGKHSLFPYFYNMHWKYESILHILHHLFMERQGFIIFYFVYFTGELPSRRQLGNIGRSCCCCHDGGILIKLYLMLV
jgi:hypothetical protein